MLSNSELLRINVSKDTTKRAGKPLEVLSPAKTRRPSSRRAISGVSDDRHIVGKGPKDAMPLWNACGSMKRKTLERP